MSESGLLKEIDVVSDLRILSPVERKLEKFFKCCFYSDDCLFSTGNPPNFMRHLEIKHPNRLLFCIFCHAEHKEINFPSPHELLSHLLENHGFRNYQCNLCMYRASSKTHVVIHQTSSHGSSFFSTLKNEDVKDKCKVISCKPPIAGPRPNYISFWVNYRVPRTEDISDSYQCLYCDFKSIVDHQVFSHVAKAHIDYELCIYDRWHDPIKEEKTSERDNDPSIKVIDDDNEDEEMDSIVASFTAGVPVNDSGPIDSPPSPCCSTQNVQPRASKSMGRAISTSKSSPQFAKPKTGQGRKRPTQSPPSAGITIISAASSEAEDSDVDPEAPPTKRRRGHRPEIVNIHDLTPLTAMRPTSLRQRNMFRCLICSESESFRETAISAHLIKYHETFSSFKCSECNFLGSKNEISRHITVKHADKAFVVKFIVGVDEPSAVVQATKAGSIPKTINKSTLKSKKIEKKNLSSKIKESVFVGPKNWKGPSPAETQPLSPKAGTSTEGLEAEESEKRLSSSDEDYSKLCTDSDEDSSPEERPVVREEKKQVEKIDEELIRIKTGRERGFSKYFCHLCPQTWSSLPPAISHMRRHFEVDFKCAICPFKAGSSEEVKEHHRVKHSLLPYKSPQDPKNLTRVDNYIYGFLNEQFNLRRKGSQMTDEQASKPIFIECPICETANKLVGEPNYRFTSLRTFKIHFWKHSNAAYIICKICLASVIRTRKNKHLRERHEEHYDHEVAHLCYEDEIDFVSLFLENIKQSCKLYYYNRMKKHFGITSELSVKLVRSMKPVKTEPIEVPDEPVY